MNKISKSIVIEMLRQRGASMLQQHGRSGQDQFFVLPQGMELPIDLAHDIIARSDIVAGNDGLLRNHPQTWRLAKKDITA